MRLRKLRIVFSAFCGLACVLLIVLWVRSYWRLQIVERMVGLHAFQISSVKGHFAIAYRKPYAALGRYYLSVLAGDAADWRKAGKAGFAYCRDGTVTELVAPHWLLAGCAGLLSATPWLRWRFTLRTLLVATTLVAVVLGLMMWLI
ncbi:MAG: hypothetical protein ACJ8LM_15765 [Candidatus Udaeobacter sp.]